jgi:hypothetical protein
MKGLVYRVATAIREYGERVKLPVLVALGIALRDFVLRRMTAVDR